jgi:hypothetical protein
VARRALAMDSPECSSDDIIGWVLFDV